MDEKLVSVLKYLRLRNLLNRWDEYMAMARKKRMSVERLMTLVLSESSSHTDWNHILSGRGGFHPVTIEV